MMILLPPPKTTDHPQNSNNKPRLGVKVSSETQAKLEAMKSPPKRMSARALRDDMLKHAVMCGIRLHGLSDPVRKTPTSPWSAHWAAAVRAAASPRAKPEDVKALIALMRTYTKSIKYCTAIIKCKYTKNPVTGEKGPNITAYQKAEARQRLDYLAARRREAK